MRKLRRCISVLTALGILVSLSSCSTASAVKRDEESGENIVTETYEARLFNTETVHTIDVSITEEDWNDLKTNPLDKTKYKVNVTIDGETIENVSFATKGNTSLSSVASDPDSDRYSFKINFGKYTDGQTYYGLNKLNLNNIYADATYMKDYLSYEIFRKAGVEAPLVSYVWLSINGEDHGLYAAIEDISESYLSRVSEGQGVLYKPESEQLDQIAQAPNGQGGMMPPGGMQPADENGQPFNPAEGTEGNGQMPPMNPEGTAPEAGMAPPEEMTPPEGMTPPDGAMPGEGMTPPEGMTP
ncbi:MAG: CotH kinase family protein, partial [Erysipelotrichaceae bacterium]|nr:CotH kinase family protein [Erysipelotrichaceae bacterium]